MSSFTDKMIEDGFDDPEEYLRYLETLSIEEYSNAFNFNIEEENIYPFEEETTEEVKIKNRTEEDRPHKYYILPRDKNWNKVIIKSIGTLLLHKIFDRKYSQANNYSVDFYTFNFFEYHEASISIFCRDINFTEQRYFKRILLGDTNALQESNNYYKNELFKHDSSNWKCSWDGIEIKEINSKKSLMQTYSIYEGKYMTNFKRNCYTFFSNQHQIEIDTKYDPIRGQMNKFDWKTVFEKTISSFKISNKLN